MPNNWNFMRRMAPYMLPVLSFLFAITAGACVLRIPALMKENVSWVDSLFIATSAVCVTGLSPCDLFSAYNLGGQSVVLVLMQAGGLGIIIFTTLLGYLIRRKITLTDRIALEQAFFFDADFNLAHFIKRILMIVLFLESLGASLIYIFYNEQITLFQSVFLSVSAFCNAGFAPWPDGLESFRQSYFFNIIIIILIISGGIGFYVLDEIASYPAKWLKIRKNKKGNKQKIKLSFYSRLVINTTVFLILAGFAGIFILGCLNPAFFEYSLGERIITALFESVTSRTAGFNGVNQEIFSSASLYIVICLMFIGGSPGSCAGGIKTTTLRILVAVLSARFKGNEQAIANGRAFDQQTRERAFVLFSCTVALLFVSSFFLVIMEQGAAPHKDAPPFFDIFFETVSAFCTVGLSINLTPNLCDASKIMLCLLMLVGKLGPIWLISTLRQLNSPSACKYAEESIPVG